MAWAFVGVGAVATVTTTAHALTEPAGCQAGDLLVAVISSRIASTTSITLPVGWTLVAENKTNNVIAAATNSEASGMMAYHVRSDAAPALTFTHPVAPSVAMGRIVAYRGGNVWSPFDVGIGAKTAINITAVSTTGLTTGEANELIVKGVCSGRNSAFSAHAATNPATSSGAGAVQTGAPIVGTWQERQDALTTTGADTALAIADAIRGTAGATGNLTTTATVAGGHAQVAGAFRIEPIAVAGGSAIQWCTGGSNFIDFIASSANSGTVSSTISVPSDAELVVVGVQGWCATANYFTNMTFTKGGADTAMTRIGTTEPGNGQTAAIFYLASPDTGSNKSLKFDWAGTGAPGETPMISVTFWKNIDTASPVRSSGASLPAVGASTFKTRTALLTALTGDLVVGFVGGDCGAPLEGSVDTWYNLDGLVQCTNANAIRHDGAWGIFPPSANLYVGADTGTNLSFGVSAAIVVKPKAAATPGTSTITQTGSTQQFSLVSGNSGTVSSTITVPSDADIVVVGVLGRDDVADYFASMTFTKGAADVAMTRVAPAGGGGGQQPAIFYLALPDKGTNKSLKFDWAGAAAPAAGTFPTVSVTFWKGVDTASPVRSSGSQGELAERFSAVTGTLTAQDGDLVVAMVGGYDNFAAEGSIDTWYNLNTLSQWTFSGPHDAAWGTFAPSGNLVVGATIATNIQYGVCAAIVLKPGAAGVTGTLGEIEDADVAAMTGTVRRIVDLATTEAADTALINATVRWAATLAETEDPDVALINATVRWAATLAETEDADVAALVGTVRWSGPLAVSEDADTALINATVVAPATGDLATTEAPDVAALTGAISWQAALATTETPDTALINGAVRWAATLATTEAPDVAAFTASVRWAATLAVIETPDVGVFTGGVAWQVTLAATEAADVGAFTGVVRDPISATLATTEAPDAAALTGVVYVPVAGTLGAIEPADAAAFTGGVLVAGTLGTAEAPDAAALVGTTRWAATLSTTEAADAAAFLGASRWIATLATTELPDTAAFTGAIRWAATLAASEAPDTAALTGTVRWVGVLATTEAPDVAALTGGIYGTGTLAVTEGPDTAAFVGGIYATGTLAVTEAPDVYAGLGTVFGAGVGGNLAAVEPADAAAFTGQITGVAGPLVAVEAPDAAAFTGTIRWTATLATTEAADAVAFLVTSRWLANLATTEARDTAAMLGGSRWVVTLAASEAPDQAAFTGIAGALPSGIVLDATEAPDLVAFTGTTVSVGTLATTEAPDLVAFAGGIYADGILDTTEAPDRALFTAEPPDIAEIPGRILRSDIPRVRDLAGGEQRLRVLTAPVAPTRDLSRANKRVRSLKYPVPRTHELVKRLNHTLTGV